MYLILSVHVKRADVNMCLGKEKYALTNNWLNQNQNNVSRVVRKPTFAYAQTKTQISFAVTAKLISNFVFAIRIVQFLFYQIRNSKPLAILCSCTAWFVWNLVGNPEDRFSHNEAHVMEPCVVFLYVFTSCLHKHQIYF